jgi:hypothetical protein
MASTLTVTTGALTSSITSQDDAAAQQVLLLFAEAIGIDNAATPQKKLDAVVLHLTKYMQDAAQSRYFQAQSAALQAQTQNAVHW